MNRSWRGTIGLPGTRASTSNMTFGCAAPNGDIDAQMLNVSSDGFRLRCADPLQVGWVVTLEAHRTDPVKAVICWACGLDAGGVFAEPVAL